MCYIQTYHAYQISANNTNEWNVLSSYYLQESESVLFCFKSSMSDLKVKSFWKRNGGKDLDLKITNSKSMLTTQTQKYYTST